jgi:kynurenine formamidase
VSIDVPRRWALAAFAGTPLAGWRSSRSGAAPAGIPRGFEAVDPRTARRVPLWQQLSTGNPIFPGDPQFSWEVFTTIAESGYLLEQITSLGTHTGTHISAPAHFHEGGRFLSELDESFSLMPLTVIDVRPRIAASGGDFRLETADLQRWERRHGRFPAKGCVLLLTGFAEHYTPAVRPGPADDYFDPAPGFSAEATGWLADQRGVFAVGSDTFGPDASSDGDFGSTSTILAKGGITVENVGAGLAKMRPHGDWVSINGARPHFSGFQMGVTGFTRP